METVRQKLWKKRTSILMRVADFHFSFDAGVLTNEEEIQLVRIESIIRDFLKDFRNNSIKLGFKVKK